MAQHFLLSKAARSLSLGFPVSDMEAEAKFFRESAGLKPMVRLFARHCGGVDAYSAAA